MYSRFGRAPAARPVRRAPPRRGAREGLRILGLFSEQRPAMKLTDIVAETGLPMPTAYRLAPKVFTLGFSALRSLTSCSSPRGRCAGSSRRPGRRRT
ncbi:helix-turn-helix domain-containing protein [Actinomadura nitritigenes]|uniref:helix-turn-helix domain-containing protein n=1 Tax=Actinomadura nitritigenes TaxID=134602 RepID=UPI0036935316